MDVANILTLVGLGLTIIIYAVIVGQVKEKVDRNEKDIGEHKEDTEKLRDHLENAIEKNSKEFTKILQSHVEAEQIREAKVEAIKDELQTQIRETVKQEQQILVTQRQTEELKREFSGLKQELDTVKDQTTEIKQDVIRLFVLMEQVVDSTKDIQATLKDMARRRKND